MVLPGGVTQTLTRFMCGRPSTRSARVAPRPCRLSCRRSSGYTYAVEYSVDEALAAGATTCASASRSSTTWRTSWLPRRHGRAGGYYDRERAVWIPAHRMAAVIKILSITDGQADLDTDGDGAADNGRALGITEAERQQLASPLPARPKPLAGADHPLHALGLQLSVWPAAGCATAPTPPPRSGNDPVADAPRAAAARSSSARTRSCARAWASSARHSV